jgi:methionyl-tRNA formyltransferase
MRFDLFNKDKNQSEVIPQVRIIFMGTPDFAKTVLEELLAKEYNIVAVYTRGDKPSGRKQELTEPPVKTLAKSMNIPVEQPEKLDDDAIKKIIDYKPDLIIVAAYGKLLPKKLLNLPGLGCLNIHASFLPRWRGASPIQNALLAGDGQTGVTIMLMDEGLDTGPTVAQKNFQILPDETSSTLTEKLSREGTTLLLETLPLWIRRKIEPRKQNDEEATLCQLIEREDGKIFWNESAETIYNQYRAFTPWPGIFTYLRRNQGEFTRVKFPRVSLQKTNPTTPRKLGEVFEVGEKIAVQTGQGLIFIEEIQFSGKDPMPIRLFLNGQPDLIGSILE